MEGRQVADCYPLGKKSWWYDITNGYKDFFQGSCYNLGSPFNIHIYPQWKGKQLPQEVTLLNYKNFVLSTADRMLNTQFLSMGIFSCSVWSCPEWIFKKLRLNRQFQYILNKVFLEYKAQCFTSFPCEIINLMGFVPMIIGWEG